VTNRLTPDTTADTRCRKFLSRKADPTPRGTAQGLRVLGLGLGRFPNEKIARFATEDSGDPVEGLEGHAGVPIQAHAANRGAAHLGTAHELALTDLGLGEQLGETEAGWHD